MPEYPTPLDDAPDLDYSADDLALFLDGLNLTPATRAAVDASVERLALFVKYDTTAKPAADNVGHPFPIFPA